MTNVPYKLITFHCEKAENFTQLAIHVKKNQTKDLQLRDTNSRTLIFS